MRNFLWLVVLVIGCTRPSIDVHSPGHSADQPTVAHPTSLSPHRLSQGEALYLRHCAGCHGWQGQGDGPLAQMFAVKAPRLRGPEPLAQHNEAELMARILYGRDLTVPLDPQLAALTDTEVTQLVGYLQRLPTIPWGEVRQGQDLYDSLCVYCHGVYGRGDGIMAQQLPVSPRDLSSSSFQDQVSDTELLHIIADGKGAMPGVGEIMSPMDVQAIVAFVRLLSPGFEQYERFCAGCHGGDGHPPAWPLANDEEDAALEEIPAVVFNQAYFRIHSEAHVRSWVRHMLKSSRAIMPHFTGELSTGEIRHILAYLRSLP